MISTAFEHDRVVSSMQKNFEAQDAVEYSNILLSAGNNPEVLLNSIEHAETLFITYRQFPQMKLINDCVLNWALQTGDVCCVDRWHTDFI